MSDPSAEPTPDPDLARPETAGNAGDASVDDPGTDGALDGSEPALQRNFRAALERKRAQQHRSEEHRDNHGAGPANNRKTTRQFRRKSG
jgi:hypothetical protein